MSQTEEFSKAQPDKSADLPDQPEFADEHEASIEQPDTHNDPPDQTLYLVGSAFFLSGLAALAYEVVWQRVLERVIGSTTPAVATILCAFMVGLGLGGFAGAELAKRRRNQLALLAVIELLICVVALVSVVVCQNSVTSMLTLALSSTVSSAALTSMLGFLLVFVLIAIPTSLMGATLPIVAGFFARSTKRGVFLTRFYAINSAGAVVGAFLTGFFLMPMLGISGSLIFASGLNLLSSSLAFLASRSVEVNQFSAAFLQSAIGKDGGNEDSAPISKVGDRTYFNAGLAVATSALSFTMQIIWTRFFVFLFGSSTHALSLVLSAYIAGLAFGAWLVSREIFARKNSRIFASIALTLSFTSLAMASLLHQFQETPALFLYVKKFLIEHIGAGFWCDSLAMVILGVPLIVLPSILIGMILPLLLIVEGNSARADQALPARRTLPKRTAILYSASLLGSVIASAYSVTLLPAVATNCTSGLEITTLVVSVLYAVAAIVVVINQFGLQLKAASVGNIGRELQTFFTVLLHPKKGSLRKDDRTPKITPLTLAVNLMTACILIIITSAALLLCRPQWDAMLISSGLSNVSPDEIAAFSVPELVNSLRARSADGRTVQQLTMYREGLNSTVSVVEKPGANLTYLRNNGKVEAAVPTDPFFPAPESDLPTQKLLGLIPAIHCSGDSLEGLVIGYGSGTTCSAILPCPWVKQLCTVELEQAVWDARTLFPSVYYADAQNPDRLPPKLTPVIADARNYLALHNNKFDFIVSQPAEPWLSGASDLFTVEFYQLVKTRLKGTGLFCQWVPLYSLTPAQLRCLVQTFQHVFPQTTIWHPKQAGELILAGQLGDKLTAGEIEKRLATNEVNLQLQKIGIENQFDLYNNAIQLPSSINQSLEDIVLNTDDNLLIEGKLSKDMNSNTQNIEENFRRVFGNEKDLSYATPFKSTETNIVDRDLSLIKQSSRSERFATDTLFFPAIAKHGFTPVKQITPQAIPTNLDTVGTIRLLLHSGNISKAAQLLASLDTAKENQYPTLCDFATIHFLTGNYDAALSMYQRADSLSSSAEAQPKAGRGLSLWMLGRAKEAIQPLRESLSIDPNQFLARYALGHTLMQSGMEPEALVNMRAAALVDPTSAWPGIFVTAKDINRKDWRAAAANLRSALKRQPLMPEAIALGSLIALRTDNQKEYIEYKTSYQQITTCDITDSELKNLAESILMTPFIITKIQTQ